jgi:uncharacterized protein (UPF0297 family)
MQKTKEIEEDKKLDQRHKLLNAFTKSLESTIKLIDGTAAIINKMEYCPRTDPAHIKSYEEAKSNLRFHLNKITLSYISQFIHNVYINDYDKEPPLNHIRGYTLYIASKYRGHYKIEENLQNQVQNYYAKMFPE